jgi:hypothetical protein
MGKQIEFGGRRFKNPGACGLSSAASVALMSQGDPAFVLY